MQQSFRDASFDCCLEAHLGMCSNNDMFLCHQIPLDDFLDCYFGDTYTDYAFVCEMKISAEYVILIPILIY